jgi:4a-hydroxytetrahydrobiopterin dehydratase
MTQEANQNYKVLTQPEIDAQLRQLPGWTLESTSNTTALTHTYKFKTFLEAIAFMHSAAPAIDELNHHPEWQNVYNKLTVRTTSHDCNNQLTLMDFRLARLLDERFSKQG